MTFLALETTGDFGVAAAALTASLFASVVARETFGYSFSTWRLHLRGETIRSANDVGFLRNLNARGMMQPLGAVLPVSATPAEARGRFPLGAAKQAILVSDDGAYAGLLPLAALYAQDHDPPAVGALARYADATLKPEMAIREIMEAFDRTEADELAVVDARGAPLGMVSEAYATRRYADELEKARRDLIGES